MITDSLIAYGDQLGAQMSTMANLVYVAKENKQDLCFYKELKRFRRRFLIFETFTIPNKKNAELQIKLIRHLFLPIFEIYCFQFRAKSKVKSVASYKRMYKERLLNLIDKCFYHGCRLFYPNFKVLNGKNGVHCDELLLKLDSHKNYDIHSGFGTYKDWKKYEDVLLDLYHFKDEIILQGNEIYKSLHTSKPTVAIHFRKGDYLIVSSLNLTLDYYKKALKYFDKEKYELVIFSDDIESCKNAGIFDGYEVHYMESHPAGVDMYVMSLCDNNIIANSSFSFWAAFLNKHRDKKVICPHDYVGYSSKENIYLNGNWYPETWTAL